MSFLLITLWLLRMAAASSTQIAFQGSVTCTLFEHSVKCWGNNDGGLLGLGYSGDAVLEPADSEFIDFGADFLPNELACGNWHCCVMSTAAGIKCFGRGYECQLGSNSGDRSNWGDEADDMGDNLPLVELPSEFVPAKIVQGGNANCVLSTEGEVVCWGGNHVGQLGIGLTPQNPPNTIGCIADQMGDNLVPVSLGSDFGPVVELDVGSTHVCVISVNGLVKCWGGNESGQLGLGDTVNRGGAITDMGDNLPITDLGTGFVAESISCSYRQCCAVSTAHVLKCWGLNAFTQSTIHGKEADTMGDNLPAVSLGSNFVIKDVDCGLVSNCAVSTTGAVKCWGQGVSGVLGYEDTNNRLGRWDALGDVLPEVNLGTGFSLPEVSLGSGEAFYRRCLIDEEANAKCWGSNTWGRLGYGDAPDTVHRGMNVGDMGDNLPFLSFGEWPQICDGADMVNVDWHDMLNEDEQSPSLLLSESVNFEASTLSLTFRASLQYVGKAADGNFDDAFNLGTTYWVDFQSFSSVDGGVGSAGSCTNRRSADYSGLSFAEMWEYPVDPTKLDSVNTAERMAYPPSDWTLTATECTVIEFERTFSWTELSSCADADGNALIAVTESADTVDLTGTFYVELVSPYSMSSADYYRTLPVLQQDFGIALSRTVNVLASTGVQLFIPSVMAYGQIEKEDGSTAYTVTVLVQSADYVKIGTDNAVTVIESPLSISNIGTVTGSGCLVASSFTCGQIFELTVDASCPADGEGAVELSGTHKLSFSPECQTVEGVDDAACTTFLSTLTNNKVVLDVDSSFSDNCNVQLWNVEFSGSLAFYKDEALTVEADGAAPFVIGQDTIYGKVTVDTQSDSSGGIYEFVDVKIESVFVCTVDPDDEANIALDASSGEGGCLSQYIDADGPYNVIGNGAVTDYQGAVYDPSGNEATFSFLTFDTPRETIQVHVQLLLSLVDTSGNRRVRRMLLQDDEAGNAFKSYMQSTAVQSNPDQNTDGIEVENGAVGQTVAFVSAFLGIIIAWIMG